MVTGLSLAVLALIVALAVSWKESTAVRKELEALWERTRDLHNKVEGLEEKHCSSAGELKRVREFTLRLQKDIHQ